MSSIRKVAVVPFQQIEKNEYFQKGDEIEEEKPEILKSKGNTIKEKAQLKMLNLLRVMSKVAMINGYDESGLIKDETGKSVENTDFAVLLLNAMSPGELIVGEQEFISLLIKANVSADLILNENIKYKLSNLKSNSSYHINMDTIPREPEIVAIKTTPPSSKIINETIIKDIENPQSNDNTGRRQKHFHF